MQLLRMTVSPKVGGDLSRRRGRRWGRYPYDMTFISRLRLPGTSSQRAGRTVLRTGSCMHGSRPASVQSALIVLRIPG